MECANNVRRIYRVILVPLSRMYHRPPESDRVKPCIINNYSPFLWTGLPLQVVQFQLRSDLRLRTTKSHWLVGSNGSCPHPPDKGPTLESHDFDSFITRLTLLDQWAL